jgi:exosortase/archaeosortase family protein
LLRKLLLFSFAIPIAIIANVVRLLVTCFGALLISASFADGFMHDFSGILVFMTGLILFFISGSILNWVCGKKNTG